MWIVWTYVCVGADLSKGSIVCVGLMQCCVVTVMVVCWINAVLCVVTVMVVCWINAVLCVVTVMVVCCYRDGCVLD